MSNSKETVANKLEKRSTSASEGPSNKGVGQVWAIKDPKEPKEPKDAKPPAEAKVHKKGKQDQKFQYQAKLMLEEDPEKNYVLIKIGQRTSTRQIIQYALDKLKVEWTVTFNAFQLEITKALQATEIIKTRMSFLHQENKLISHTIEQEDTKRVRSGISITLSKQPLVDYDPVGYQKPKPRQFLQPPPGQKPKKIEEDEKPRQRPRRSSAEFEDRDKKSTSKKRPDEKKGEKKNVGKKKKSQKKYSDSRSQSGERDHYAKYDHYRPYYVDYDDRYEPKDHRRGPKGGPKGDAEAHHEPPRGYKHPPARVFMGRGASVEHFRGAPPGYFRGPPPRYFGGGPRGDPRGPPRGDPREEFDVPDRPGFYSGNRQFRMDKFRDQPLEKSKNYQEDRFKRDGRNRPQK